MSVPRPPLRTALVTGMTRGRAVGDVSAVPAPTAPPASSLVRGVNR